MSKEVKRYTAEHLATNYPNRIDNEIISGPYVTASDYDSLAAECERLRARVALVEDDLKNMHACWDAACHDVDKRDKEIKRLSESAKLAEAVAVVADAYQNAEGEGEGEGDHFAVERALHAWRSHRAKSLEGGE